MGFDYTCRLTRGVEIFVETVDVFLQKFLGSFFFPRLKMLLSNLSVFPEDM